MTSVLISSRCLVPVDMLGGLGQPLLPLFAHIHTLLLQRAGKGDEVLEQRWQWGLGDVNLEYSELRLVYHHITAGHTFHTSVCRQSYDGRKSCPSTSCCPLIFNLLNSHSFPLLHFCIFTSVLNTTAWQRSYVFSTLP